MIRFLLILTILGLLGCGSDDCEIFFSPPSNFNQTVYQADINTIQNYISSNMLDASSTASGLHYIIETAGDENKPELCDQVTMSYRGYFLDGREFDSSNGFSFSLLNLIPAWQEGVPLFGKGGKGTLLCPSYLAYGPNGVGNLIPPNTVLAFDIELIDF